MTVIPRLRSAGARLAPWLPPLLRASRPSRSRMRPPSTHPGRQRTPGPGIRAPDGRSQSARAHSARGDARAPGLGGGEGGGSIPPGRGRRPQAKWEPRLHATGLPTGLPTAAPESGSVPHTLQQAPPLRRHLGETQRARPLPSEQTRGAARAT